MKTNFISGGSIAQRSQLNTQYWEAGAIGNVFYVDSTLGSSSGPGQSPEQAFATVDQAMDECTASNGDVIVIMPGHTETYSTTGEKLVADKAGVRIVGYGKGASRPTFTFSHTGATWTISGNGAILENLLFVTGIDSVVTFATVSGSDVSILDCECRDTTDIEVITDFTVTGDRLYVRGLLKNGYTGGNANARVLSLNGVDRALIEDCRFVTKVTTAVIGLVTTACTGVIIRDCDFLVTSTTDLSKNVVDTITGSTWSVYDSFDLGAGASFSGGSGAAVASDDVSTLNSSIGTLANTGGTATLGGILGDPANVSLAARLITIRDALFDTTGIASYPAAAAAANGVSIAEVLRYIEDILVGSAGVVTWASGAAPANGVSLSEALRYVAENIINGGTALPATCSVYDLLAGANGVPTFPAAAAPANNVSIAEVVRAIYDRQLGDGTNSSTNSRLGKKVTRNAADIFDGTAAKSLFTVSGGRVLLTHFEVEVTAFAVDASASNMNFVTNPTVGTDMNLAAVLDINADELGTIYSISGVITDAVTGGSGGGAMGMARPIVVPEGAIAITTAADVGTGGALGKCELWYIPMDDGASVAAA